MCAFSRTLGEPIDSRVLQAASDYPDVPRHHHHNTEYDQVFHGLSPFSISSEIGTSALTWTLEAQPGHGWPHRSQLQAATGLGIGPVTVTVSCNSHAESAGLSFSRRSVFIGSFLGDERC